MPYEVLQRTFLGNTLESYCWFFGIVLVGLMFQRLLSKLFALFVFKFLQKYSKGVGYDKLLVLLKKPLGIFILLIAFYLALDRLEFPAGWNLVPVGTFGLRMFLFRLFQLLIAGCVTWIILRLVDFFGLVLMHRASLSHSKEDDQLVPFIREALKVVVVIFSAFFVLGAIFKLNVASLIAGLGIGGLAIALAAKESLENLMGSFTIFLDKPFSIGDQVKIGTIEGNVEKIGFRSTRIRTLEKSFVTVPNKKMVDNELDNLSLRVHRLAKFNIGLTYETKPEQIKSIAAEINSYIENHNHTLPLETRVRLFEFDESSINLMVVYYVDTVDSDIYLKIREEINYKIMEIIEKHGSSFAYPTRTVFMKGQQ